MSKQQNNKLIVSLDKARAVKYCSSLCVLSGLYAIYSGNSELAKVPFSVFVTSILYWSNPIYGWRRNLDIITTQICLWWQIYKAAYAEYGMYYYSTTSIAIMMFGLGWIAHIQNPYSWTGTYCQIGVHVFANIANIILYSGKIND